MNLIYQINMINLFNHSITFQLLKFNIENTTFYNRLHLSALFSVTILASKQAENFYTIQSLRTLYGLNPHAGRKPSYTGRKN